MKTILLAVAFALLFSGCTTKIIEREVRVTETHVVTETVAPSTVTTTVHHTPSPSAAPTISWTLDEVGDKWSVSQAPNEIPWNGFELKASLNGVTVRLNNDPNTHKTLTPAYSQLGTWGNVGGGDDLNFCGADTRYNIELTLRHIQTGTISNQRTFSTIAAC